MTTAPASRDATTAVYQTVEIALVSDEDHANPYLDVDVEVLFAGPKGATIRRPAFWDGGRTWRVRFAPTMPGHWLYRTSSNRTTDNGLHGVTGDINCVSADAQTTIHRHGFLRRAEFGRHLSHDDGTPFFWLADTHWRFRFERQDEANKPGWDSQFRGTIDKRVDQGFTVYQANLMTVDWSGEASPFWCDGEPFTRLNPEYIRDEIDPRIAYIADAGLVTALGFGWHGLVDDDPDGVVRFARYIVARYGSFAVVWTLGGEVPGYDPDRVDERLAGWLRVGEAIRDADGYGHPITVHSTNDRPIATTFIDEDWLTFGLNQHGHGDLDLDSHHYADFFSGHPSVPLVEGESLYEGLISVEPAGRRLVTDTMVRHAAYQAIQSGCCGYSYGAQGCWNGAWDTSESVSAWGRLPWYDGVDLPGAEQMGFLRRYYEVAGWQDLTPADAFLPGGFINRRFYQPPVLSTASRSVLTVYFPDTYRTDEPVGSLVGLPQDAFDLRWFDPRSGEWFEAGIVRSGDDGSLVVPQKPSDDDWLLLARSTTSIGCSPRKAPHGDRD
ncbi:MAG: hypothetical protein JWP75_2094 [Frondihabitans sp.]|nr:hypothetical protein [Frondihabitans sp.]